MRIVSECRVKRQLMKIRLVLVICPKNGGLMHPGYQLICRINWKKTRIISFLSTIHKKEAKPLLHFCLGPSHLKHMAKTMHIIEKCVNAENECTI